MSNLAPTLRTLVAQAEFNSQVLNLIGVLALKTHPDWANGEFMQLMNVAVEGNRAVFKEISLAVKRLEEEQNG
jgi:hypothetical protein